MWRFPQDESLITCHFLTIFHPKNKSIDLSYSTKVHFQSIIRRVSALQAALVSGCPLLAGTLSPCAVHTAV